MSDINNLSEEGMKDLKKELKDLKTSGRANIAKQLEEAREKGDLSENAEYDAAKEAQGHLELKISQLETYLANSRLMDDSKIDTSKALVLSTVRIRNKDNGQEFTYKLVAETEANLQNGKISVNSPIGKSLLGRSVGEWVVVKTPAGKMKFNILEITRD